MAHKVVCIVLFGPTASGKTGLSLRLAEYFNGAVINGDSRQIYKGLPILTAMPSAEELAFCPHYLFEKLPLNAPYSVSAYVEDVKEAMADILRQNKMPIICGGTGFYLKVLEEGISPIPNVPKDVLTGWNQKCVAQGVESLYEELEKVDPELAQTLNKTDTQRIIRGLSVHEVSGQKLSDLQKLPPEGALDAHFIKIALLPKREEMYNRIHQRFDKMMQMGLLDEVKALEDSGLDMQHLALQSIGVEELMAVLSGGKSLAEAKEEMLKSTRHYAKRQCTWLRSQFGADIVIENVNDEKTIEAVLEEIKQKIKGIKHE